VTTHAEMPSTSLAGSGYRVTVPAPRPEWTKAFLADPSAQAFHSPEWVDGVCTAGGFQDATRLYEAPDGRRLVMPMVRRPYLGGAVSVAASLPANWGIGGVLSDEPVRPEDLSAICADLRQQRTVLRTTIRPAARTGPTWAAADLPGVKATPSLCHVLELDGDFAAIWEKKYSKSARRSVRKAEKAGVVVERDTTGARLAEHFRLMEDSLKRWAEQQHEPVLLTKLRARQRQSLEKFQALAAAVPGRFHLYLAVLDGQTIATNLVYQATGTRATSAAMIKELAGPVGAMQLLDHAAIEDACRAGSTHYDFGESGASSGLAMYKTRFGAEPRPYPKLVIERLPFTEADHALRSAVKRVIGFQEPGAVAESAGEPAAT
jgi:CelD/BcsL family acetyltransferase involved in cellulose biosynthesis